MEAWSDIEESINCDDQSRAIGALLSRLSYINIRSDTLFGQRVVERLFNSFSHYMLTMFNRAHTIDAIVSSRIFEN